jgi:HAD superfamily phosphatase (TIGR01668 family)
MVRNEVFFRKVSYKSVLLPDYAASSVLQIPLQVLLDRRVAHVIVDIDGTLVVRQSGQLDPAYVRYFETLRHAGVGVTIGTNTRRDVSHIAEAIGAGVVPRRWWTYKPMHHFYRAIIKSIGLEPQAIAMIGDRVLNDVVAANRLGLVTFWVLPLGKQPSWFSHNYLRLLARR